jgi:hypothetical protein
MKTLEEGSKKYRVVAGPGMKVIDVYRAALILRQQRPDVGIQPICFTNLEPTQYLVELTTSDETIVTGFRRLVEVARDLRQCPPEGLPQEVLLDPQMREIVVMGYLQEEARELFQPQPLQLLSLRHHGHQAGVS